MKKSILSVLTLLILIITSTSTYAVNYVTLKCNASCTFSSCDLTVTVQEGSGTGVICGCYFGIAVCRSGTAVISGLPTRVISIDAGAIVAFDSYLGGLSNSSDFYNVRAVLANFSTGMTADDYETARDNYLEEVNYLSPANQQIIQDYVDNL
jgi:hypothetical protein